MLVMSVEATGALLTVPLVAEIVVNAPVEGVVEPIALLSIVPPEYAPPEIVFPPNANALSRFKVTAGNPVAVIAPDVPETEVTGAVPFAAEVTCPCALIASVGFVYDPAVTPVDAIEIVPVVVIVPPFKPVPAEMLLTVPPPPIGPQAPPVYPSNPEVVEL